MTRLTLTITAIFFVLAGCGPTPDSSSTALPGGQPVARQSSDIPPEQIIHDIVGRVVQTTDALGAGPPDQWTFEADEFRQVDIVESERSDHDLTVVINMTTRNNPKSDEDDIQVSGKLRLHYERQDNQWILKDIENLTFQYSIGVPV